VRDIGTRVELSSAESVESDAMLTVNNSIFSGNPADFGGCIFNDSFGGSASLTLSDSTLSGNSAHDVSLGNTLLNSGALGDNVFNDSGTIDLIARIQSQQ
jgi:hypothetical protein